MKRYSLSGAARRDLNNIKAYYMKEAGARVARYVLGEITVAFTFLVETPGAGHSRLDLTSEPLKFWPVFSYMIIYVPAMQPLGIARVLHGSQDIESLLHKNGINYFAHELKSVKESYLLLRSSIIYEYYGKRAAGT